MNGGRADALAQALSDFDGKSTGPLERFAAAHNADAVLVADLCDFAAGADPNLQAAATWLLKRFGVTGAQLSARQCEILLRLLLQESSWLSRLHVLQMMHTLDAPAALAAPLMAALRTHAMGDNKFICAWSAHGAAALADQHPEFRDSARDLLVAVERDEAASVQARLRRTRRAFDWL